MEYKSFKEFYWKSAIYRIGLPWGFFTGIIFVVIQDKDILNYFLSLKIILQVLGFMVIGGSLMALSSGKHLWKIYLRSKGDKENEPKET